MTKINQNPILRSSRNYAPKMWTAFRQECDLLEANTSDILGGCFERMTFAVRATLPPWAAAQVTGCCSDPDTSMASGSEVDGRAVELLRMKGG